MGRFIVWGMLLFFSFAGLLFSAGGEQVFYPLPIDWPPATTAPSTSTSTSTTSTTLPALSASSTTSTTLAFLSPIIQPLDNTTTTTLSEFPPEVIPSVPAQPSQPGFSSRAAPSSGSGGGGGGGGSAGGKGEAAMPETSVKVALAEKRAEEAPGGPGIAREQALLAGEQEAEVVEGVMQEDEELEEGMREPGGNIGEKKILGEPVIENEKQQGDEQGIFASIVQWLKDIF